MSKTAGIRVGNAFIRIARCEGCDGDTLFTFYPAGWTQTGGSKYGDQYEEDGIAWWCPKCYTSDTKSPGFIRNSK